MSAGKDVLFELNVANSTITFVQGNLWRTIMPLGRSADYTHTLDEFLRSYVDRDDRELLWQAICIDTIQKAARDGRHMVSAQFRALVPSAGEYEWFQVSILSPHGGICYGTIQNVNNEKEEELMLLHRADHDALTDLLNRSAFERRIAPLLNGKLSGFFFIVDIDNFKTLNDTKGHQYGDRILTVLAGYIRDLLPDRAILGRFGGDEFVNFCPGDCSPDTINQLMKELKIRCASGCNADAFNISVGVSIYPDHGRDLSTLLSCADRALYFVKQNGKNGYSIFTDDMPMVGKRDHRMNEPEDTSHTGSGYSFLSEIKSKLKTRLSYKKRRLMMIVFTTIFIMAAVMGIMTGIYLSRLRDMVNEESASHMSELARQMDVNIAKAFSDRFYNLSLVNQMLDSLGDDATRYDYNTVLSDQKELLGSRVLAAVDSNGRWYCIGSQDYLEQLNDIIAQAIESNEPAMSDCFMLGEDICVAFVLPIDNIPVDGLTFKALISVDRLDDIIAPLKLDSAFNGKGFAYILDKRGNILVSSEHPYSNLAAQNIFSKEQAFKPASGYRVETIQADFNSGRSGFFRYVHHDVDYVGYYSPLSMQDWYLLNIAQKDSIEARYNVFARTTTFSCLAIALLMTGIMGSMLFYQLRTRKKLEQIAYVDPVTGGKTKALFLLECRALIDEFPDRFSIVYTNVERFKTLNERYGHSFSDGVLGVIHNAIIDTLSPDERCARIMADQFAVLIDSTDSYEVVERVLEWNRRIVGYGNSLDNPCNITVTYGCYRVSDPQLDITVMLDHANSARKTVEPSQLLVRPIGFYDVALRDKLRSEQEMEARMENALSSGEFKMYLQPQYDLCTGEIAGYEALVRWVQPEGRTLMPGRFIPLFERNGFITKLDLYMFAQACRCIRELIDSGREPVRISVNVSKVHLLSENFLSKYIMVWRKYDIPGKYLELEFTESVLFDNPERLNLIIDQIHELGFKCSMDDFGSGYSSLNMLHNINIDIIKLDKSFLGHDSELTERGKLIVKGVVDIANALDLQIVAEGVETVEQKDFLANCGCGLIQGFYFAKPMDARVALGFRTEEEQP